MQRPNSKPIAYCELLPMIRAGWFRKERLQSYIRGSKTYVKIQGTNIPVPFHSPVTKRRVLAEIRDIRRNERRGRIYNVDS